MAKNEVVMIQNDKGECNRVRINGAEVPVVRGGPQPVLGSMQFVLTVPDVEVKFELDTTSNVDAPKA